MKRILPVIHLIDEKTLFQNIETCLECNINQVFIINHITDYKDLLQKSLLVKNKYPEMWIGINCLDLHPQYILNQDFNFDGVWIDQTLTLKDIENKKFRGEVFSGLNFKYQKQFENEELKEMINLIKITSNIACTSGSGTGKEAPLEKIKNIKALLGDFPLALASGVSVNNIESYLPYVNNFLVASSITDKNEVIDRVLLQELCFGIK
jgi:hypothetical protein